MKLSEILSPHLSGLLAAAGIHTVDDVLETGTQTMESIDGIGPKTANDIWARCSPYFSGQEEKAPGIGPVCCWPPGEPTIDQAAETAEVDQDALTAIAPVIAAGMVDRLYHPSTRFMDELELVKAAIRVSKLVLAELQKA